MEGIRWKEIEDFDDLISDEDRTKILEIEGRNGGRICPLLGRIGDFFHYCDEKVPIRFDMKLGSYNPFYKARQDIANLQLLCMGEYENCNTCQEYFSYLRN